PSDQHLLRPPAKLAKRAVEIDALKEVVAHPRIRTPKPLTLATLIADEAIADPRQRAPRKVSFAEPLHVPESELLFRHRLRRHHLHTPRDSDYLDAQLKETDIELARNYLFQFPAQVSHLFLVKPRCVPLDGDSHRSRHDQCQVVSKPQRRLDFAVVLVCHGLNFHHTAASFAFADNASHALASFASAISTSTRSGSPVIAYTCNTTTWLSSRYATPFSPSMIDFAALSMSALLPPFEYSHSFSA